MEALPNERQPRHGVIKLRLFAGHLASRSWSSRRLLVQRSTESSPIIVSSPLNGGVGLAGKSGRKTANAWDTNASEMSADTTAHLIFVGRNSFTKVSRVVVQQVI